MGSKESQKNYMEIKYIDNHERKLTSSHESPFGD